MGLSKRGLILDSSVCVDLQNGGILEVAFRLPLEFHIPDVIIEDELISPSKEQLLKLGVRVAVLAPPGVLYVVSLSELYARPSRTDLFALACAKEMKCILLSGGAALRSAAATEEVEVHGTLWVLDQLVETGLLSTNEAVISLNRMLATKSRFPKNEVEKRMKLWEGG